MSTLKVVYPNAFAEAMLVSSTVPENDYPTWSSATTYVDGDRVIYQHRIYESTAGSNLNHNPSTDTSEPPWWVDIGPTNRWACLDAETSTVTTATGPIEYVFEPGRFETLALIDLQATSVHVEIVSPVDGPLLDQTYTLGDSSSIPDWYQYFYAPIRKPRELVIDGLVPLGDVEVTLTISNSSGDVEVGTLVFGWTYPLGRVPYGARAGIIDYSRKETDEFGTTSFVRRAFSKRADLSLVIDANNVDFVHTVLAELRATPCLWVGADGLYTILTVFGYYKDFSIDIAYPTHSVASLELEGLI